MTISNIAQFPLPKRAVYQANAHPEPWLRWLLFPLLLAPVLIWLELRLDVRASAYFFDIQTASFPWRENWLTKDWIHQYGRLPAALIFLWFAVASLIHLKRRHLIPLAQTRFVCITMMVCLIIVNLIKRSANTACSWDLIEFGGTYPHLNWFESLPNSLAAGHCWPGAFSLSGFALIAVYFYLFGLAQYRRAARVLVLVLLYANALGFVQVMRGAHGVSHQVWTGVICWYLSLMSYWIYTRRGQQG